MMIMMIMIMITMGIITLRWKVCHDDDDDNDDDNNGYYHAEMEDMT